MCVVVCLRVCVMHVIRWRVIYLHYITNCNVTTSASRWLELAKAMFNVQHVTQQPFFFVKHPFFLPADVCVGIDDAGWNDNRLQTRRWHKECDPPARSNVVDRIRKLIDR